ncbi:MAG: hypothetical protein L3K26_14155 [Candidatus Hydrogenedentes bacterium]|nr:hypothetical protein [Candidatus Hydrogenedentota bacterium]
MTNQYYWQTIVGELSPEEFLRAYGTADPELGLERFLEDRGQLYGVINQGSWKTTFVAATQHTVLTAQVYLRSYLEETRETWEPALEAQPPKVVRRYRPVYDFPVPGSASAEPSGSEEKTTVPDAAPDNSDASPANTEEASPETTEAEATTSVEALSPEATKSDTEGDSEARSAENSADAPAPDAKDDDSNNGASNEEEHTDGEDNDETTPEVEQPVAEPEPTA